MRSNTSQYEFKALLPEFKDDLPLVAFLPTSLLTLNEFQFIATELHTRKLAHPVFFLQEKVANQGSKLCQESGLHHLNLPIQNEVFGGDKTSNRLSKLAERIARKLWGPAGGLRFARKRYAPILDFQIDAAMKLLQVIKPHTLVMGSGRTAQWELAFIKACREQGVRSVVPSVAYAAARQDMVKSRKGLDYFGSYHKDTFKRFPEQYAFDGSTNEWVSCYPAFTIWEASAKGALLPNPWILGGGICDLILVSGQDEFQRNIDEGVDPQRLLITGLRSHDLLFKSLKKKEELRREIYQKYSLSQNEKLLIASLPSLAEHGWLDKDQHQKEIHFLLKTFMSIKANCLISLHPRIDPEQYDFIGHDYGLKISNEPLGNILAAADVFTASFSSTIEWAVLLGIPAVVVDFYGFNYDIYDHFEGVSIINVKSSLQDKYQTLLSDSKKWLQASKKQIDSSGNLSPFDGRCTDRIIQAIVDPGRPS